MIEKEKKLYDKLRDKIKALDKNSRLMVDGGKTFRVLLHTQRARNWTKSLLDRTNGVRITGESYYEEQIAGYPKHVFRVEFLREKRKVLSCPKDERGKFTSANINKKTKRKKNCKNGKK